MKRSGVCPIFIYISGVCRYLTSYPTNMVQKWGRCVCAWVSRLIFSPTNVDSECNWCVCLLAQCLMSSPTDIDAYWDNGVTVQCRCRTSVLEGHRCISSLPTEEMSNAFDDDRGIFTHGVHETYAHIFHLHCKSRAGLLSHIMTSSAM